MNKPFCSTRSQAKRCSHFTNVKIQMKKDENAANIQMKNEMLPSHKCKHSPVCVKLLNLMWGKDFSPIPSCLLFVFSGDCGLGGVSKRRPCQAIPDTTCLPIILSARGKTHASATSPSEQAHTNRFTTSYSDEAFRTVRTQVDLSWSVQINQLSAFWGPDWKHAESRAKPPRTFVSLSEAQTQRDHN